jgi:hypothetical protein
MSSSDEDRDNQRGDRRIGKFVIATGFAIGAKLASEVDTNRD